MKDEKTIFQQVKEQIDPRELVSYFLGEPTLKSGDNWFWHSPFCEGDNQPSFCASPEQITDFSGGYDIFGGGQDIFDFIVKYNSLTHRINDFDLNNYEALNWVNEHYNLGFDLSSMSNNSNNKKEEIADKVKSSKKCKTIYSLETVENATKAITEGIMTMFCDINDECMGDNNLRNSLLNKESTDFDSKKYSLFLYLSKGPVWRIQGISALLSSTGSIIGLSEISTPPIGLLLITKNTKEEKINGLSINEFANYKYDEKATADFSHLPIHEVNTQMPMDFRSKEEIIQCINNNRQIRDTLFGKEVND